jgi:hypothetical protein
MGIEKGYAMPTIAMFYGIIIQIFSDDHNPAHLHARYAEFKASFDLDGHVLAGKLPPKQQNFVSAWIQLNKEQIEANIENLKNNFPLIKIGE